MGFKSRAQMLEKLQQIRGEIENQSGKIPLRIKYFSSSTENMEKSFCKLKHSKFMNKLFFLSKVGNTPPFCTEIVDF